MAGFIRVEYQVAGGSVESLDLEMPATRVTGGWAAERVHAVRGVWPNRVVLVPVDEEPG